MGARESLQIHLVGSVPLSDAETVFRTVCDSVGPHLRRLPDGETGARRRWVGMLSEILDRHPAFEPDPEERPFVMRLASGKVHRELTRLRIRPGINPEAIRFETGYAAMAKESFGVFTRLQGEGVIPSSMKFQVAIPSPLAPTYNYIGAKSRSVFLELFTQHLLDEVRQIAATLPVEQVALQWDVLQEILIWENYFPDRPANYRAQILEVLGKIGDAVPQPMELGYHLCYGSPKDEHLVQPRDAGVITELIAETLGRVRRPIDFMHFPVPKDRTDQAFYRPLRELTAPPSTQLFVGLAHVNDHEGNRRRLEQARDVMSVAGVASECGWGRSDPSRVGALLDSLRRTVTA